MILLISYGGGHIAILSRVYKFLIKNGLDAKILPLTTAVGYCNKNSIDYLKIEELFDIDNLELRYKEKIIEIAKENHNEEMNFPFIHTLAYYAIGLSQLFSEKGYKEGLDYYKKKGRQSFLPTNFAKKVINHLNPKAIITTNVPRMELAFRKVAMASKIKVFAIDDLNGYFGDIDSIYSDVVFVGNVNSIKRVKRYKKSGEVIVSGNPVFDDINKLRKTRSKVNNSIIILLQTGIRDLKINKIFEFSDSFFKNFFINLEESNFLNSFDNVTVRFHPSMNKKRYWKSKNFLIDDEENIHQSLLNHSNALGLTSTSIYEAYLLGSSVYRFSFKKNFFNLPFGDNGVVNLNGEISFSKKIPEPILNNDTLCNNSLQTIYNTVKHEVFKN